MLSIGQTMYAMKCIPLYIRVLVLTLIVILQPVLLTAQIPSVADTLITRIHALQGEDKLEAYAVACNQAATRNDRKDEFRLLRDYLAEAARQKDVAHETQARTYRLYAFYNNNLSDSLNACMDDDLHFMSAHRQWVSYYSCRSLRVERLQYDNKLQSALREAQSMYDHATTRQVIYGKGISAYLIACCYQSMGRNEEAADFFSQAEELLSQQPNAGQMHNLYGMAWQSLASIGQYDELLALTSRWETMWKDYCKENDLQTSDIAPYYMVCLLAKAHAHTAMNNLSEAREQLDQAGALALGQRDIALLLLLKEEALYEEAAGNYRRALEYLDRRYRIQTELNNRLGTIETQEMRARLLTKLGQFEDATLIFTDLMSRKDSLNQMELAAQLDDLGTIYQVDILKKEKQQFQVWMILALTGFGLSVLLVLSYIYYRYRLHGKNKVIRHHIQKETQTEKQVDTLMKQVPGVMLKQEDSLFLQIRELLQNPEVLADASLNRETLAKKFSTNRSRIAEAIKSGSDGMGVMEYINKLRIEYACALLEQKQKLSVRQLAEQCGFNSYSSFYRIFKEHTGMTPNDYSRAVTSK